MEETKTLGMSKERAELISTIILAIAAWRRDTGVRIYVTPIAIIGGLISVYHYLIQWFPDLEGTSCTTSVPCTGVWFREFGFISIPYLALSTFALVLVLMLALRTNTTDSTHESRE